VVLAAGCWWERPTVSYAPGFVKENRTISIFGVFRDGRMNPEIWEELGPSFATALRREACGIAVGGAMRVSSPPLFSAIDSAARSDGITDELLEKFAAAAQGDSILVIVMTGRLPKKAAGGEVGTTTTTAAQMRGGGGGGRPPGAGPGAPQQQPHAGHESLELSASLYSKKMRQSAAMVAMTYKGTSEAEAFKQFAERVAAAFPGATCEGWLADLGVDPESLR
jgi:hypothetical protein